MEKSIRINYLYRDGGNYKLYGSKTFSNNTKLTLGIVRERIQTILIDGLYFEPEKLGVNRLTFDENNDDLDHDWHEIESIEFTDEPSKSTTDISEIIFLMAGTTK